MSYLTSKRRGLASKIVSAALMVTTFVWLVGVPSAGAATTAETIAALMAQIQALTAQLNALQAASGTSTSAAACTFARSLTMGARGDDVKCLQQYLTSTGHFTYSGGATGYFGSVTKTAVAAWQAANSVSPAVGYFGSISQAKYTAVAGSTTTTTTTTTTTGTTTTTTPAGTGLTVVAAGTQPEAGGLFGENFASRPFTKVNFTASADGDITVKSVTVERGGQSADAVFNGIVLLDENGVRMGTAKTLNSNHQVVLNDSFVVKAGTTKTITIAGDSDNNQDAYTGQLAILSLVAVDAGSATVNGSLPIVGPAMTVNSTLSIGTITLTRGTRDPGVSASKEVGVKDYTFSALKLTAGSAEDMLLETVRWNQSGSVAASDMANLKVYIDGDSTAYDAVASSDGKYYTTTFGSGVTITKGEYKEIYIKGDIVSGSGRTADFDLYRYADAQVKGKVYGYDALPTATEVAASADDGDFHAANPNYDAFQVTIGNGTINVEKATSIAAQNIAISLSGQPLGGFDVEVKGEDITVAAMKFDVAYTKAASGVSVDTNDITSISLYDDAGTVIAGPVDGAAGGVNAISFSDTVTFKVGKHTYTLKGKLGTDFANNDQLAASTTPSTQWTTVKGVTTGNSITPTPSSAVTGSTMTVKSAALNVTTSPTPSAQNVVAGTNGFTFANYVFDATGSGEDIRVTSVLPTLTFATANTADDLTNCQLWDGTTALNTGTNIVNPSNTNSTGDTPTFTLDNGMTVTKGTVKTIALKCNVRANPDGTAGTSTYQWGIVPTTAARIVSTGLTSGKAVTETGTTSTGQAMTIQTSGSISVVLDSSSPALKWVQAGATDQTLAVLRVTSSYEDVVLSRVGLSIATSTSANDVGMASNTPSDVSKVSLWNGAKKIGEATFSSGDFATSTFTTEFGATTADYTVKKDEQMLITVKGDIGTIGTVTSAYPGHLIMVNYDAGSGDTESTTNAYGGMKGIGASSGTTVYSGGSTTASNGARITKAIPTVEKIAMGSTELKLSDGQKTLYKFKVTAPAGTNGISLYKFTFDVATATGGGFELPGGGATVGSTYRIESLQAYCYSDANFSAGSCGSFDNSGLLNQGGLAFTGSGTGVEFSDTDDTAEQPSEFATTFNPSDSALGSTAEAIRIPAGETRYFALKGTVTGSATTTSGVSATAKMLGDATFAGLNNSANDIEAGSDPLDYTSEGDSWTTGRYVFATTAANVDSWDDDDFIWSGNSTNTTMSINTYDWFNGYLVSGMPTTYTTSETLVP